MRPSCPHQTQSQADWRTSHLTQGKNFNNSYYIIFFCLKMYKNIPVKVVVCNNIINVKLTWVFLQSRGESDNSRDHQETELCSSQLPELQEENTGLSEEKSSGCEETDDQDDHLQSPGRQWEELHYQVMLAGAGWLTNTGWGLQYFCCPLLPSQT